MTRRSNAQHNASRDPARSAADEVSNGRLVSLKTLAEMWDADRSTVRRWLHAAGIEPVAIGRGRNGAIRYRWRQVQQWLDALEHVE